MRIRIATLASLASIAFAGANALAQPPDVHPTNWSDSRIIPASTKAIEPPVLLPAPEIVVPNLKKVPTPLPMPIPVISAVPAFQSITLSEAVLIANRQGIDSLQADQNIEFAAAAYLRAKVAWLPNIDAGSDYFYHSGAFENNSGGPVQKNIRQTAMYGVGWNAVVPLTDAIYAPRSARRELQAREAQKAAVNNDLSLSVIEAYFTVLQYYGESIGAQEFVKDAEELVRQTGALAEGLIPPFEVNRAKVELSRRRQAASTARERYRNALADLTRLTRQNPVLPLIPAEPANMKLQLIDPRCPLDDMIAVGLTNRPELASQQAFVLATLERLKQEKMRPLIPSLAFRSTSTNPSGSLAVGSFGAGSSGKIGDFGGRFDYDIQVIWELENLGLGNLAKVKARRSEHQSALLELLRTQDRIAAEVVQAHSSLQAAMERVLAAEPAFDDARELLKKNIEGLTQTRRVGNLLTLIIRPQEVVAALQSLGQANTDYYAAIADYNRTQFRLYRAMGHPISSVISGVK